MASFLDTGLISAFSLVFTFLLVYTLVWGMLTFRKPFGDNKGLYAMISLAGAFLFVGNSAARSYVEFITPWFLTIGVAFFMIIIVLSIFTEVKWIKVLENPTAQAWIIIIIVIILVTGLAFTFGQTSLEATTDARAVPVVNEEGELIRGSQVANAPALAPVGSGTTNTPVYEENLVNTIVHPKVLGMFLIFVLGAITVYFLSKGAGGLE